MNNSNLPNVLSLTLAFTKLAYLHSVLCIGNAIIKYKLSNVKSSRN